MRVETGLQQFCITKERNQVPKASVLDALITVAFLGAIKLVETVPFLNAQRDDRVQELKSDLKKILAMAIMALEVRYLDRGWIVPFHHPLVDDLNMEQMKAAASAVHQI